MSAVGQSAGDMLSKLEQVRQACLADSSQYSQVVPGIVPILQTAQAVEVRRWGADFMAEAFATPALPSHQKEQLISDTVMALLRGTLESPNEDETVVKSAIQACASIYPYVFRRIISHPDLALIWHEMTTIKINILQKIDAAPIPVRIGCIKFLQKVVQVQTPGVISDPRRPEHNETSIALVPRNHPLLPLPNLEAETSGILDRLLSVIEENSVDPLLVDPTMNSLAVLIKTRPAVQAKILQTVLNYNPLRAASGPMTPRLIVVIKSLQRTTRALLRFVLRILPQHPLAEKIDIYLRRLQNSTTSIFTHAQSLKRPAEQIEGQDPTKRPKIETVKKYAALPPGPNSVAQLFTLIDNPEFQQFDVKILPEEVVCLISSALMQHIDSKSLDEAIEEVQQRLQKVQEAAKSSTSNAVDEDDDYDPEAIAGPDEMMAMKAQPAGENLLEPALDLGPFELSKPEPLTETELAILSQQTVDHVFETALTTERNTNLPKQKLGINRLAGSTNDKESWLTLMIRLATRAPAGLDSIEGLNGQGNIKSETQHLTSPEAPTVPNMIRHRLFEHILEDWRHRLSLAITWLTEEWYVDKIEARGLPNGDGPTVKSDLTTPHYDYWTTRLFETLIPRFDKDDHRILIRFLSELPSLNRNILSQVRALTRDPATVDICKKSLQYLYLMRPPVRELVVDTMEDIWQEGDEEVRSTIGQLLQKWRPGFAERILQQSKGLADTSTYPNGVKVKESRQMSSNE